MLASSYPFLDVMWTMLVFFLWIMWFWLLIGVFADIFRRHDLSGWGKTGWLIFVMFLPFLGVFVYLISQNKGMTERSLDQVSAQQADFETQVRKAAGTGGPAAEIEAGKKLLDSGAITQTEFDAIKTKALAAA